MATQQLIHTLAKLRALRDGLENCLADAAGERRRLGSTIYIVDFNWLYTYLLSDQEGRSGQTGLGGNVPIMRLLASLSFFRGPSAMVLLPEYFDEFRSHLRRRAQIDSPLAVGEHRRRSFLDGLREKAAQLQRATEIELQKLQQESTEERRRDSGFLLSTVRSLVVQAKNLLRATSDVVVALQRMGELHDRQRLIPASEPLPGSDSVAPLDDVVAVCLATLRASRPDRTDSNHTDARALGRLAALSTTVQGRRLAIVTNASRLRAALDQVEKRRLVPGTHAFGMRDSMYWMWWFAAIGDAGGWTALPDPANIDALAHRFRPVLDRLQMRANSLASRLRNLTELEESRLSETLNVEALATEVDRVVQDIAEPLIGNRWLVGDLESLFSSSRGTSAVGTFLARLISILEGLEQGLTEDERPLKQLAELLEALERFSATLEGRIKGLGVSDQKLADAYDPDGEPM